MERATLVEVLADLFDRISEAPGPRPGPAKRTRGSST
jgi:hypothetical protein